MQKQEILTALGLLSLLMIMVHLKNEPSLPLQEFNEPEIEFSEFESQVKITLPSLASAFKMGGIGGWANL